MGPSKGPIRLKKKKKSLLSINEDASTIAFTARTCEGVTAPLTRDQHVEHEDFTPTCVKEDRMTKNSFDHRIRGIKKKKRSLLTISKAAAASAFTSHACEGVTTPLTRHSNVDHVDFTAPYMEENGRDNNSPDHLTGDASRDDQSIPNATQSAATPRDEQQNLDATQNAFASNTTRKFVLPPNQRRSYRESRSKYRRPLDLSTRGLSVELGDGSHSNQHNNVTSSNSQTEDIETTEIAGDSFISKKGIRGITSPSSCRPKHGDPPLELLWVKNAPVGKNAEKFGRYLAEEAKIYHRYPLHKEWDEEQTKHAYMIYESAQQKDYLFYGEDHPNPEYDGERIPLNELKIKIWIKTAINHSKNDWRHTIKANYYKHWVKADDEQRVAIVDSLSSRIPTDQWPLLCAYFASPEKMAEAERNSNNRNCKDKLKAPGTQGSITMANAQYRLRKKHGDNYNGLVGWLETHKPVDEPSMKYIEKVQDAAHDLPLTHETDVSILSPILDSLSGHHGGYERAMGRGYKRRIMIDDSLDVSVTSRREHDLMRKIKQQEAQIEHQQKRIDQQQEQIDQQKEKIDQQQEKIDQQQRQLEEMHRRMESQQVVGGQTINLATLVTLMSRGLNIDLSSIRFEDGNVGGSSSRRSGDADSSPTN